MFKYPYFSSSFRIFFVRACVSVFKLHLGWAYQICSFIEEDESRKTRAWSIVLMLHIVIRREIDIVLKSLNCKLAWIYLCPEMRKC